ncbi:MAG: prolipoprotein diacylglyceryl transferase family protein [Chloroflexota bacterium]
MLPFISLGPLAIPSKPLIIIIGVYLSLSMLEMAAGRLKLNREAAHELGSSSVIAGFVGARLVFVLLNWSAFSRNLISIAWPLTFGYNLWAGLIIGILFYRLIAYRKSLNFIAYLDPLAAAASTFLITLSLADWLGGPGFGAPAEILGLRRHPVQAYEMVVGSVALGAWWWFQREQLPAGRLFGLTAAVISAGLLITIPFRGNPWLIGSGWHVGQLITLVTMITSLLYISLLTSKRSI